MKNKWMGGCMTFNVVHDSSLLDAFLSFFLNMICVAVSDLMLTRFEALYLRICLGCQSPRSKIYM